MIHFNSNDLPNPGSKEAQELGCICAVYDNHYGQGRPDGSFWITQGCVLHNPSGKIPRLNSNGSTSDNVDSNS